jgi:hypothetical protein
MRINTASSSKTMTPAARIAAVALAAGALAFGAPGPAVASAGGSHAVRAVSDSGSVTAPVDVTNLPFTFCFRYNGQPNYSLTIWAPDPNSAAITAEQMVYLLNTSYPPLWSATAGSCW